MNKIGTHNSSTGEKPQGLLSYILTPFARTQTKTLAEQWKAGCRYFDFRLREDKYGRIHFAHGAWMTKRTATSLLVQLEQLASTDPDNPTYAQVTYEGETDASAWLQKATSVMSSAPSIIVTDISIKKPTWKTIVHNTPQPRYRETYIILDFRSWHTYLPIPWLWNKLYTSKHEFDDTEFNLVDFL